MKASGNCSCAQKRQQCLRQQLQTNILLNNFPKLYEFATQDHVSHYPKFKISPYQHGFSTSKSAITNLTTYVDVFSLLVGSQTQADAIYLNLSNAKLSAFSISGGYVN
jgi:hypothetical protein